ncbi:hypothetical protein J2X47_000748 [Sphingomonas sp. BE270]|nr:hypothetical protein [Sphingomonas sp. BE270]
MTNDLVDDEAEELLAEIGIEIRIMGKASQPRDLCFFTTRIGRRQTSLGLIATDRLRGLEAFGEQKDEGGIDIVDALAVSVQRFVGHHPLLISRRRSFACADGPAQPEKDLPLARHAATSQRR